MTYRGYKAKVYRKQPQVPVYRKRTATEELAAMDDPTLVVEQVQYPDPPMTTWQRIKLRLMRYVGS